MKHTRALRNVQLKSAEAEPAPAAQPVQMRRVNAARAQAARAYFSSPVQFQDTTLTPGEDNTTEEKKRDEAEAVRAVYEARSQLDGQTAEAMKPAVADAVKTNTKQQVPTNPKRKRKNKLADILKGMEEP